LIQRQPTKIKNREKNCNKESENHEEEGESDFQSYYIAILKYLVFSNKITRHTKKQESMVHSKEKNKSTEAIPL
jgi:hypothetical protein